MIRFAALAIVLALTGCTSAVTPAAGPSEGGESSSPSSTPTATQTPTPTAAVVDAVVITASEIELADADGNVIDRFPYDADPKAVSAALEQTFGTTFDRSENVTNDDGPGTTDYYWDDFSLRVSSGPAEGNRTFWVASEGASVGPVAIQAVGGVAVGDAESDVASLAYDHYDGSGGGDTLEMYSLDKTIVDVEAVADDGGQPADSVRVWVPKPGALITRIDAPIANYGS